MARRVKTGKESRRTLQRVFLRLPLASLVSVAMMLVIGAGFGLLVLIYPQRALVSDVLVVPAQKYESPVPSASSNLGYQGELPRAGARSTADSATTTMLFVGDMMFDRTVAARSRAGGGSDYPFRRIGNLKNGVFGDYDLVIGNLEGPVNAKKHSSTKSINFSFATSILPVLKKAGFDAVSQANNHSLDQGRDGSDESLKHLASAGIGTFGDQVKQAASSSMTVLESRGRKFAFLGFNNTDVRLDMAVVGRVIDSALRQADFVIVFMHWGDEYKDKPNKNQVALGHWFIERGASAVIGGHPHWMESIEVYRGKPIVYSLGNFIFDQDWSKETNYGLTVGLGMSEQGSELKLFPIKIEKSQPFLLTGDERMARLDRLAAVSDKSLAEKIKMGTVFFP